MKKLAPLVRSLLIPAIALTVLSLSWTQSSVAAGTNKCSASFSNSTAQGLAASAGNRSGRWLNPNYREVLNVAGKVTSPTGIEVANSIKAATERPEIQQLIENSKGSKYKILLNAELPPSDGGGRLRLVILNTSHANLAYNHVELVALLNIHPQMANALGFYRVPNFDYAVWVPDVVTIRHRLKVFSQNQGFAEPLFSYEQANGVIGTKEYVETLSRGKFPFSNDSDVNLSVHDSMHSIAFAMLNSTPSSRKIMNSARSRNRAVMKIFERIQTEIPSEAGQTFAQKFLEKSKWISSDSLERTMLLTILVTGNYDYFSAYQSKSSGTFAAPQNREITRRRVQNLVEYFNYGTRTFAQTLNEMLPESSASATTQWASNLFSSLSSAEKAQIREIFSSEVSKLKTASAADIEKASHELMQYFSAKIFSDSATSTGVVVSSTDSSLRSAGPETLETLP